MSKILEATCEGGVVKVGTLPVAGTTILSEGVGPSQGLLLLEGAEKHYLAKTTPDLKTTLEKLSSSLTDIASALTEVGTALTTIAAVPSGWVTPPASVAANVATILSKVSTITAAQAQIDNLKGMLK